MAAYASLTDAQKNNIAIADRFYRSVANQLASIEMNNGVTLKEAFIAGMVDPVIATLDPTEILPNSSQLLGAQDMLVSDWLTFQATLRALTQSFQTNLALLAKAIGVQNVKD